MLNAPPTVKDPNVFADRSVVEEPAGSLPVMGGLDLVIGLATTADEIPIWGRSPQERDRRLRDFWPTESVLASAMYSTMSRYAAFGWHLNGPDRQVAIVQRLLHGVEFGEGWIPFIFKVLTDLFSQDNGAFVEIVRTADSPMAPCISLNHLDSNTCYRTGHRETPVIYYDVNGKGHEMKWYQVIPLVEFPSPIQRMRGMQYCAVTRVLRAAQILRDIAIYKSEKVSGRFIRGIHLVGGVHKKSIDDAIRTQSAEANAQGLMRYIQPLILAGLDPNARVSHELIELASLPDSFDEEVAMRWYINQLALAFGVDFQDFAPLPGGNLGTAQQSQVLHLKARSKGPALFMRLLEHIFNFHGVLPSTVTFGFGEQDVAAEVEQVDLKAARATERANRIASGEITVEVAQRMALDQGDLTQDEFDMLAVGALPDTTTGVSSIPVDLTEMNEPQAGTGV